MISRLPKFLHPYQWMRNVIRNNHYTFEELQHAQLTFSQFGEDLVVSSLPGFDKIDGYYVDIGAFHPIRLSNTYFFHRKGWKGINVEPNPKQFPLFEKARKADINLNLAISASPGTLNFICEDQFSRISSTDSTDNNPTTTKVRTETLSRILDDHLPPNQQIDFLSVDCEGHDLVVIESNDWTRYRPKVILVEEHGALEESEVYQFLIAQSYSFYVRVGLTLIFLESKSGEDKPPSYPVGV